MTGSQNVLIIDEHVLVREALEKSLTGLTFIGEVHGAGTLREAVESAAKLKPAVALLDWTLPDAKGMESIRALKKVSPRTRVVVLSAKKDFHRVREAVDHGVSGFVMKHATLETLLVAVRAVLENKKYYCAASSELLVNHLYHQPGPHLTDSERLVLQCIARGENIKSVAARRHIRPKTVYTHVNNLKNKLGIYETAGLVRYAIKHGLVEPP